MTDTLRLEVVTPSHRVLEARASEVRIPGALGELGVLPGHTPLLTSLGTGELKWTEGTRESRLVVQGGFAEIQPDAVTVLATVAENIDQIDLASAELAHAEALDKLKTASAEEFDELNAALRLAEVRKLVASGGGP